MQSSNGESFEWLLLKANLFRDSSIKDILEKPEEYIDSKEFLSWEQFFTSLIIEVSKDTYLQYSKKS